MDNRPRPARASQVRPGRVNLKLYLGYVDAAAAREMCAHYYGGAETVGAAEDAEDVASFITLLAENGRRFAPANLEHLCATHDSVAALAAGLGSMLARVRADAADKAVADAAAAAVAAEVACLVDELVESAAAKAADNARGQAEVARAAGVAVEVAAAAEPKPLLAPAPPERTSSEATAYCPD